MYALLESLALEGCELGSEENKAADRRYVEEVLNQGNVDAIDELRSDDLEGVRNRVQMFRTAFPDLPCNR